MGICRTSSPTKWKTPCKVQDAPNSDGPEPTFTNEDGISTLSEPYSSIRNLDFRNLRLPTFDVAGRRAVITSFKNESYKYDRPTGHYSETVNSLLPSLPAVEALRSAADLSLTNL